MTGISVDNIPSGVDTRFFSRELEKIFFFLSLFAFFSFRKGFGDGFFIGFGHCLRFLCQRSRLIPEEED